MDTLLKQASLVKVKKSEKPLLEILIFLLISIVIAVFAYGAFWVYGFFTVKPNNQPLQSSDLNQNNNLAASYDAQRKTDLEVLKRSLLNYKTANSLYPNDLNNLVPQYLPLVPIDPETKGNYTYQASLDQKSFRLSATLEDGNEYTVRGN